MKKANIYKVTGDAKEATTYVQLVSLGKAKALTAEERDEVFEHKKGAVKPKKKVARKMPMSFKEVFLGALEQLQEADGFVSEKKLWRVMHKRTDVGHAKFLQLFDTCSREGVIIRKPDGNYQYIQD